MANIASGMGFINPNSPGKLFKERWEKVIVSDLNTFVQTINSFLAKYHPGLNVTPQMTEREWMSFDNEFKSLMDDLSLIGSYNGLLTQMCYSASLEQLDAAMMTEHLNNNDWSQLLCYWLFFAE